MWKIQSSSAGLEQDLCIHSGYLLLSLLWRKTRRPDPRPTALPCLQGVDMRIRALSLVLRPCPRYGRNKNPWGWAKALLPGATETVLSLSSRQPSAPCLRDCCVCAITTGYSVAPAFLSLWLCLSFWTKSLHTLIWSYLQWASVS